MKYNEIAHSFNKKSLSHFGRLLNLLYYVLSYSHYLNFFSDLWCEDSFRSKRKCKGMEMHVPEKRKKPATVTGIDCSFSVEFKVLHGVCPERKG